MLKNELITKRICRRNTGTLQFMDKLALMNDLIDKGANAVVKHRGGYVKTRSEFWPHHLVVKSLEFWKNKTMKVEEYDGLPVIFSTTEQHEEIFEKYHEAMKTSLDRDISFLTSAEYIALLELFSYLGDDVIYDRKLIERFEGGCWYAAFKAKSLCHPNPLSPYTNIMSVISDLYRSCEWKQEDVVDAFAYYSMIYTGRGTF